MRLMFALVAALALPAFFAPVAGAASKVLLLPVPSAGDVTVANVTFTLKGRSAGTLPAPRVAGRGALGPALTVVGGLRRTAKPGTLLATAVVARQASGAAGVSGVSLQLRLPRGARFGRFVRRHVLDSVVRDGRRPPYCSSLPATFTHVAARPLAGRTFGYDARAIAKLASQLGCRSFPERGAFLGALGSEGGGEGGGGSGGRDPVEAEGPEDGEEDETPYAPTTSETLSGSGTVTRDAGDPRRFSYSISFNEPIHSFKIAARPATIHCPAPTYAAWYSTCSPESLQPGGGLTCTTPAGGFVYELECAVARDDDGRSTGAPLPAGTVVNGVFTTDPERPAPTFSSVELTGYQEASPRGKQSRPTTIPVS